MELEAMEAIFMHLFAGDPKSGPLDYLHTRDPAA